MPAEIALIVNAGGTSRRMGLDKALLRVPETGMILVEHVLRKLQNLATDRLIVVENNQGIEHHVHDDLEVSYVSDIRPNLGPLGGMIPALALCKEWAMVVACDMPNVRANLFAYLLDTLQSDRDNTVDAIVPVALGRIQPMHAVYHCRCRVAFQAAVDQDKLSMRTALNSVRVRYVPETELRRLDPQLESFLNINTPEEWAAFQGQSD